MFSSSVILKLSRSEEIFAETESFVSMGARSIAARTAS